MDDINNSLTIQRVEEFLQSDASPVDKAEFLLIMDEISIATAKHIASAAKVQVMLSTELRECFSMEEVATKCDPTELFRGRMLFHEMGPEQAKEVIERASIILNEWLVQRSYKAHMLVVRHRKAEAERRRKEVKDQINYHEN